MDQPGHLVDIELQVRQRFRGERDLMAPLLEPVPQFSGNHAYTGATAINGGTLVITGATQNTSAITFDGGVLGFPQRRPPFFLSPGLWMKPSRIKLSSNQTPFNP